jgi:hypothetical protein
MATSEVFFPQNMATLALFFPKKILFAVSSGFYLSVHKKKHWCWFKITDRQTQDLFAHKQIYKSLGEIRM